MPEMDPDNYGSQEEFEERYDEALNELYWSWRVRWEESTSEEYNIYIIAQRKYGSYEETGK